MIRLYVVLANKRFGFELDGDIGSLVGLGFLILTFMIIFPLAMMAR